MQYELIALYAAYRNLLRRWQWVTLPGMKSRAPIGAEQDNNVFQLLDACVLTLFEASPRIGVFVVYAGVLVLLL